MSDDRHDDGIQQVTRRLSDLLYAPIGLVAGASRLVPELAEQGRIQVNNARMMGRLATKMGTAKLTESLGDLHGPLHGLLVRAGLAEADPGDVAAPRVVADPVEDTPTGAPAQGDVEAPPHGVPEVTDLAIVDYDSLAASQVVRRLAALDVDELEAVRRYELANRGRKTILGRVAQLQN